MGLRLVTLEGVPLSISELRLKIGRNKFARRSSYDTRAFENFMSFF